MRRIARRKDIRILDVLGRSDNGEAPWLSSRARQGWRDSHQPCGSGFAARAGLLHAGEYDTADLGVRLTAPWPTRAARCGGAGTGADLPRGTSWQDGALAGHVHGAARPTACQHCPVLDGFRTTGPCDTILK